MLEVSFDVMQSAALAALVAMVGAVGPKTQNLVDNLHPRSDCGWSDCQFHSRDLAERRAVVRPL